MHQAEPNKDGYSNEYRTPKTNGLGGLRQSEAFALRVSDLAGVGNDEVPITKVVKLVNNRTQLGPPKSKAGIRTVYLPPQAVGFALAEHIADPELCRRGASGQVDRDGLLFSDETSGEWINANHFRKYVFHPAVKRAALDPRLQPISVTLRRP